MPDPAKREVTELVEAWPQAMREPPTVAAARLDELRRVARPRLARRPERHARTALVHEAYLRLIGPGEATPRNRVQLFGIAARLMREILVDHARRNAALKRGGPATKVSLDDAVAAPQVAIVDVLALDEALGELSARDARLCQVVELKFFAGLTIDETATALQVSVATVERDWAVARAWLHQRLASPGR